MKSLELIKAENSQLALEVIKACTARELTLSCAESLTAGLACSYLADVPGASAVLRGGLVVYATDLKVQLAGVDQAVIDRFSVISPEVARQLAHGVRIRLGADIGLGLTGVAGPDPQDGHAVGECYLGVSTSESDHTWALEEFIPLQPKEALTREYIRHSAVNAALSGIACVVGNLE